MACNFCHKFSYFINRLFLPTRFNPNIAEENSEQGSEPRSGSRSASQALAVYQQKRHSSLYLRFH